MDWSSIETVATALLSGSPLAIAITALIAFSLPLLLHLWLYRSSSANAQSYFLLLGPSGSGKTSLLSLLERKSSRVPKPPRHTHTSQTSSLVTVTLPPSVPTHSNRFRSVNDPSLTEASRNPITYQVKDTPGHGKLRDAQGLSELTLPAGGKSGIATCRAVIFMVDSAALADGGETLRDTARYLHDALLILQKRLLNTGKGSTKRAANIPVLVAANKQDLFTALPAGSTREKLEGEIEKIRRSKSKGLMDAGVGVGPNVNETEEEELLGADDGQSKFSFQMLQEEVGIRVDVIGGAIQGDSADDVGAGLRKWEEWVGSFL